MCIDCEEVGVATAPMSSYRNNQQASEAFILQMCKTDLHLILSLAVGGGGGGGLYVTLQLENCKCRKKLTAKLTLLNKYCDVVCV